MYHVTGADGLLPGVRYDPAGDIKYFPTPITRRCYGRPAHHQTIGLTTPTAV